MCSALARAPLGRAPAAAVDGRVSWVQVVRGVAAGSPLAQAAVGGVPLIIVVERTHSGTGTGARGGQAVGSRGEKGMLRVQPLQCTTM